MTERERQILERIKAVECTAEYLARGGLYYPDIMHQLSRLTHELLYPLEPFTKPKPKVTLTVGESSQPFSEFDEFENLKR